MKWTIAMTQEELKRKTIVEQAIDKSVGLQYILYSGEKRIAGKGIIRYC